ncbi:MAG: DNA topoisomerase IV [Leeuwenhoekiella sp.]
MKKRLLYLILLLAHFFVGCYSPERDCSSFKTGTFEFETYLNGKVSKTTFTRNDSLEVDYYEGKADSSSIRWINNCEYIANKINPQNRSERQALHFKIITTTADTYTFEYSIVGKVNKERGTAKKVSSKVFE